MTTPITTDLDKNEIRIAAGTYTTGGLIIKGTLTIIDFLRAEGVDGQVSIIEGEKPCEVSE